MVRPGDIQSIMADTVMCRWRSCGPQRMRSWRRPESQGAQGDASDTQDSAAGETQGEAAGTDNTGSSQAQRGEVRGPPAADGTTEGGGSVDEAVTKPVNGTAATSFKEENSWYKSPFIWIGIATVLAVIGILGYHLKKR